MGAAFTARLLGEVVRLGLFVLRDCNTQEIGKNILFDDDLSRSNLDGLREVLRNLILTATILVRSDRERDRVGALLVKPEGQVVVASALTALLVFDDRCTVKVRALSEELPRTASDEKRKSEN